MFLLCHWESPHKNCVVIHFIDGICGPETGEFFFVVDLSSLCWLLLHLLNRNLFLLKWWPFPRDFVWYLFHSSAICSLKNTLFHPSRENNTISVWNNGKGIPVVEHKVEKVYVPALIFGQLLTSSNYDDDEKKVTGREESTVYANIFEQPDRFQFVNWSTSVSEQGCYRVSRLLVFSKGTTNWSLAVFPKKIKWKRGQVLMQNRRDHQREVSFLYFTVIRAQTWTTRKIPFENSL